MSDTDKTRPYWVQLVTEPFRVEVHDHRSHECNLPSVAEIRTADALPRHFTDCHYTYQWDGRNHFCGCPLCTGQEDRRADRRRSRHQARNLIHRGDYDRL